MKSRDRLREVSLVLFRRPKPHRTASQIQCPIWSSSLHHIPFIPHASYTLFTKKNTYGPHLGGGGGDGPFIMFIPEEKEENGNQPLLVNERRRTAVVMSKEVLDRECNRLYVW